MLLSLPTDQSTFAFGQLTIWNIQDILARHTEITEIMNAKSPDWIVNVICISERKNYILTSSEKLSQYFTQLLNLKPENPGLFSNQLYLRKEILSKMLPIDHTKNL